jgi:hypothetical protein
MLLPSPYFSPHECDKGFDFFVEMVNSYSGKEGQEVDSNGKKKAKRVGVTDPKTKEKIKELVESLISWTRKLMITGGSELSILKFFD